MGCNESRDADVVSEPSGDSGSSVRRDELSDTPLKPTEGLDTTATPGEAADEDEGITMEEVLIRCNNILYIRAVPDGAKATFTPW